LNRFLLVLVGVYVVGCAASLALALTGSCP